MNAHVQKVIRKETVIVKLVKVYKMEQHEY